MHERVRSVVVGIAEIADGDPNLAPAAELADALGATLHLVHAFPAPDPVLSALASDSSDLERRRSEIRSRLETQAGELGAGSSIVSHAVPGSAADAILDVAQQEGAGLVVVGATQQGALASAVVGTTAQRVLRASPVPVLVNRRPGHGPPRRVLLTTDLSKLSAAVHERGLALLTTLWGSRAMEVRSLFVAGDDVLLPPPVQQMAMRKQAEERLEAFLERIEFETSVVEGRVRLGLSAREILAEAEEWAADLLVLGTHGRVGISRFLIGSVAETALRKAPCDVLLIPTTALGSPAGGDERLA
jgi:nucleotide-binding universal stress UspA family protein